MKRHTKWIVTLAAVATLGLAAVHDADARGAGGNGPGWGCGGNCVTAGGQVDEKTVAARDKFFKETKELRKELVSKRAELGALMHQDNPDAKVVGQLSGELFDLQSTLSEKAEAAGINEGGPPCGGFGGVAGPGMMRGSGFGGMWN